MGANLIEQLRQVVGEASRREDFRTTDGTRHPLWLVLLFVRHNEHHSSKLQRSQELLVTKV